MKRSLYNKLESFIDKSIPYLLILLLVIIISHLFFYDFYLKNEKVLEFADKIIIGFFIADLIFKYNHVKNIPIFIKKYWLDILAVFPFYLILRLIEEYILIFRAGEELATGQKIAHTTLEVEREFSKVIKSAEIEKELKVLEYEKLARGRLFFRFLRPITRIPRFFKAIPYYEKKN